MAETTLQSNQCFLCDKDLSQSRDRNALLLSNLTEYSRTGLPTKIGQLMGDGFMVVVTACDEACNHCYDLLNLLDKLEVDLSKVRRLLTSYLRKKYGLIEIIKEEPPDSGEDRTLLFDERATRNLEEEVSQVMYGKGGHLDIDFKTAIMEENSKICDIINASANSKHPPTLMHLKPIANKLWKCKTCSFMCKSSKELRSHEKSHITLSPKKFIFGCSMCDFKASTKSELSEHSHKHVFPKTFECESCNKSFSSQVELDDHASTHKIYQCADCGAAFEQIESLTMHECVGVDHILPDQPPVICVIKVEQSDSTSNVTDQLQSEENSQSTDFDSLCRDTLQGESEFSEVVGNLESEPRKDIHVFSHKHDASSEGLSSIVKQIETQGDADEDMDSVIGLFSDNDQFDMVAEEEDDVNAGQDLDEDEDGDFLTDSVEGFDQDKISTKSVHKYFVNGVEVSFSDMVEQEGDNVLPVDMVSTDLDEITEETRDVNDQMNKQKVFVCSICKYRTEDQVEIQKHLESHGISFSLECQICQMKLKNQRTYDKHMQRHLNLKSSMPAECPVCKEIAADKFALRKHMFDNHPEVFKCSLCSESFESKRARQKHEASHNSESDKTCNECGKVFKRLAKLNEHKEFAHREILKCQHCEKQFDTIKKLKDHERRHLRDKEGFPCSQCDRVLKTSSGLKLHRAKHTGQYKFCCHVCGNGFMSKAILDEHMGRHTQEKRYTCDVCGKMFVFNSTMRIHRRWHDNPLPYKCKTCGQKFRHTSLLSVHRRRMHTLERPYKCSYCPLTFTVSNCLKRHLVLHTGAYPFFCTPCNKGFTTKQKMAVHLAKVHNDKEMLNTKAPPCEYKMVIPNTPIQAPPELDDVKEIVTSIEGVEHAGEVQHVIIQSDEQQLEAEGNIQLQIITMDPDHSFTVFE